MKSTIQQVSTNKQGSSRMHDVYSQPKGFGIAARNFVHNVLREYGEVHEYGYYVQVKDLDLHDKKILLSYIIEDFEYEDALSSISRLNAYLDEYDSAMQKLLNSESEEAYQDFMEEASLFFNHIYS